TASTTRSPSATKSTRSPSASKSTRSPSTSSSRLDDYEKEGSEVDITEEEEKEVESVDDDNNKGNESDNIYCMLCSSNTKGFGCECKDTANYILKNLDMYDEHEAKKHASDKSTQFSKEISKLTRKLRTKDPNMFNKNKIVFQDLSKKHTWDKYELHLPGLAPGKYNNERDVELNKKLIDLEDGFTDTQYIRKLYSLINENEKEKFDDIKRELLCYCASKNKSLHRTTKESEQAWKYTEKLIKLYYNDFDKHFEKVFLIWLALSEGFDVFEYKMLIAANRLLWRKLSDKVKEESKVMIQD
ncbi:exported protein (PHISTb), partial [Plasmodium reichenowi]